MSAQLCPIRDGADRAELESFVRAAFARRHGASVRSLMPELLSLRDAHGRLRGVIGLRAAAAGPLFLEQYLDQPIEQALAARVGRAVAREEIVEIGNLAGASCRAAVGMVAALPRWLVERHYRWIVFTATRQVREILAGFGAPLVELAVADPSRIAQGADEWGEYYSTDPRVFAGYLPDGLNLPAFGRRRGH